MCLHAKARRRGLFRCLPLVSPGGAEQVFAGSQGWELNDDAIYVLDSLTEMKQSRSGAFALTWSPLYQLLLQPLLPPET